MKEDSRLETFFAYRSLHSDESWGAVLGSSQVNSLPNIDFGMTVFANNEKEAIARARDLYEKIHRFDSERGDMREFAKEALNAILRRQESIEGSEKEVVKSAMKAVKEMNDEFNRYFENVGKREIQHGQNSASDEGSSGEW